MGQNILIDYKKVKQIDQTDITFFFIKTLPILLSPLNSHVFDPKNEILMCLLERKQS